jgi:hypothetical protein
VEGRALERYEEVIPRPDAYTVGIPVGIAVGVGSSMAGSLSISRKIRERTLIKNDMSRNNNFARF